jgi:hypothetical protein
VDWNSLTKCAEENYKHVDLFKMFRVSLGIGVAPSSGASSNIAGIGITSRPSCCQ